MCSSTPESYLCHCISPGRRQEPVQRQKEKKNLQFASHNAFLQTWFIFNCRPVSWACWYYLREEHNNGSTKWRIKRAAAFKPPVLVGWEAEPGLAVEQWFCHNEHPQYSTSLYLLQMEGSPISIQMRLHSLCLFIYIWIEDDSSDTLCII